MNLQTLSKPHHQELIAMATLADGETPAQLFRRAACMLEQPGTRILSLEVFGFEADDESLKEGFGRVMWPVTQVQTDSPPGVQLSAVQGVEVEPIHDSGRIVGSSWADENGRYCRLGDLRPADAGADRAQQVRQTFETMERILQAQGMSFAHVARTWFYIDRILDWYGQFNRCRDEFFSSRGVFDGLVPASTGVGGGNPSGAALTATLLAVKPASMELTLTSVPSPLQCPALEYGSSFSRALEITSPGAQRLYVSGTASIAPGELKFEHVGDVDAQIERTVEVVEAILQSRQVTWAQVTRAIGYFKHLDDLPAYARAWERLGLPDLPILLVQNDLCFDELLFELEVDAAIES
ncbi:MAG: translation initiation inhibitor [Gemmatimonadetes bacterium]|nr:translation initiation inhibitor [Gemmatimonadota bacterium]